MTNVLAGKISLLILCYVRFALSLQKRQDRLRLGNFQKQAFAITLGLHYLYNANSKQLILLIFFTS